MYKNKEDILKDLPELELTDFGDFKIKDELVKNYEIIDFHCHLFEGVKSFIPKVFRKSSMDLESSFFDLSCYPISLKYFDFNKELFTTYPEKLLSFGGLKLAYELSGLGGFIYALKKSTPQRMLRDMKLNNICKAVVLQLNTPDCDSSEAMSKITSQHEEFISFGCIHPDEREVRKKIDTNIAYGIKGWKIAPHVIGITIDDVKTIKILKQLSETKLPIISCSGLAFPQEKIKKIPKHLRSTLETQDLKRFYNVLKEVPDMTFIFAHAAIYQTHELIELMKLYPNTYAEISTQPPHKIKQLINALGSERLLYGTDYPAFNHALSLTAVLRATQDEEERKNIFSCNAKRLLKIECKKGEVNESYRSI